MIHVHQCFNAVGHGTFFSGLVRAEGADGTIFSWIYDCGSKRPTQIAQEISELEGWPEWPHKVDLLVLSHFDDDHVNGLERLLLHRSIEVLALPYMDVAQRLMNSASVVGETCSASTALLQLDPFRWLKARGLSDRVGSILFVRGGPRGDNDPPVDADPRPLPGPRDSNDPDRLKPERDLDETFHLDYLEEIDAKIDFSPRVVLWEHAMPASYSGLPVELMFFNSEQPDFFRRDKSGARIARRSGMSVRAVQSEIQSIMKSYGLLDLSRPPRRKWRDALRVSYDKHFGSTSQQRNNISLCLLVRPRSLEVGSCGIFSRRDACRMPVLSKAGLLCLGDLRIDQGVLSEMQKHFGPDRWSSIACVQVPHHGSRHSWEKGNAAAFAPDWFVQCVPDWSALHPHTSVTTDLQGFQVLRADYRHRVAFEYHFPL